MTLVTFALLLPVGTLSPWKEHQQSTVRNKNKKAEQFQESSAVAGQLIDLIPAGAYVELGFRVGIRRRKSDV